MMLCFFFVSILGRLTGVTFWACDLDLSTTETTCYTVTKNRLVTFHNWEPLQARFRITIPRGQMINISYKLGMGPWSVPMIKKSGYHLICRVNRSDLEDKVHQHAYFHYQKVNSLLIHSKTISYSIGDIHSPQKPVPAYAEIEAALPWASMESLSPAALITIGIWVVAIIFLCVALVVIIRVYHKRKHNETALPDSP
jgi:hypothetical protein